jgi:hypothetical protein
MSAGHHGWDVDLRLVTKRATEDSAMYEYRLDDDDYDFDDGQGAGALAYLTGIVLVGIVWAVSRVRRDG